MEFGNGLKLRLRMERMKAERATRYLQLSVCELVGLMIFFDEVWTVDIVDRDPFVLMVAITLRERL